MAKTLQHRRDSTANLASVSGAIGEFFMDTTKKTVVVMDGSTNGGNPLALESSLTSKQDTLVSGTNIKTVNGSTLLGSGDITISGGGGATDLCGLSDVTTTAISQFDVLQSDYYGIFHNVPTCQLKNLGSVGLSEKNACIPSIGLYSADKNFLSFEHLGGPYGTTVYKNVPPQTPSQCSVVGRSIIIGQQTLGYTPGSCYGYTDCVFHVDQIVLGTKAGWGVGQASHVSGMYTSVMNCSNVIIGTNALSTSGLNQLGQIQNNIVIGHYANACARTLTCQAYYPTTTNDNIILGTRAALNSDAQGDNIIIGQCAFKDKKGGNPSTLMYKPSRRNIIIGTRAGSANCASFTCTTITQVNADSIIAIGDQAAAHGNFGPNNVAIGDLALSGTAFYGPSYSGGYVCNNTAVGHMAGFYSDGGHDNTFFGANAGKIPISPGMSGNCNTFIGATAGSLGNYSGIGGSGITVVGANTGHPYGMHGDNVTLLGFGATPSFSTAENEITLGNTNIYTLRSNTTTITSLSDARDKESIESVPYGLDFLKKVRPVSFTWNSRDGAKSGGKQLGFIAQELDEAMESSQLKEWLTGLVLKSNPDRLEASEGKLLPLMVKAIQELDQRLTELENKG